MIILYLVVVFIIIIFNVLFSNVMFRKKIESELSKSNMKAFCLDQNLFTLKQSNSRLNIYQIVRKDKTKGCHDFDEEDVDYVRCTGLDFYQKSSPCSDAIFYLLGNRV